MAPRPQDFREIWENITVRRRHGRCNQFISFTRLTFTSILSYKKEKRNELTLMKNENHVNSTSLHRFFNLKRKSLKHIVQFFCSSRIHVHVGVHPLFIRDFIYISLLYLLVIIHWSPDARITFRDCRVNFVLLPTIFLQTSVICAPVLPCTVTFQSLGNKICQRRNS